MRTPNWSKLEAEYLREPEYDQCEKCKEDDVKVNGRGWCRVCEEDAYQAAMDRKYDEMRDERE